MSQKWPGGYQFHSKFANKQINMKHTWIMHGLLLKEITRANDSIFSRDMCSNKCKAPDYTTPQACVEDLSLYMPSLTPGLFTECNKLH